jgi:hypothetical protein
MFISEYSKTKFFSKIHEEYLALILRDFHNFLLRTQLIILCFIMNPFTLYVLIQTQKGLKNSDNNY